MATCREIIKQNLLVILTFVSVGVGFLVGFLVSPENPSPSAIMWIGIPGELYIRSINMMIVPLVVCSIISGTAKMDPRSNGKISGVSLGWITATNLITPIIAAVLCTLIKPGVGVESGVDRFKTDVMQTEDIFADLLRNIVPDNLIASCFRQAQTKYEFTTSNVTKSNGTTANYSETVREMTRKYVGSTDSTNVLGLVIVSCAFGVATAAMAEEQGKAFLAFFKSATDVILKILQVLIWTTPIGVTSLTAKTIITTRDVEKTFRNIGWYALAVEVGLIIWGLIVIPLIFLIVRRRNPFKFIGTIMHALMIVLATASAISALPASFHALETRNKVDIRISRFVAPLSASIGRAGGALYITSSCIFIMQMQGRGSSGADIILVVLLTWVSALAIPSVTGASLVTALILLRALNIPGEAAAMLFPLEFFLDRSRSVVNLITQLAGVVITDTLCKQGLPPLDDVTEPERADLNKMDIDKQKAPVFGQNEKDQNGMHFQYHDNNAFNTHM